MEACDRPGGVPPCPAAAPAALQERWVIANHILVSFHVAFISSVLALPPTSLFKWQVLRFVFASPETLVSAVFAYLSFHIGMALHEMGHSLTGARLNALNERALLHVKERMRRSLPFRWLYYLELLGKIPLCRALRVTRESLNYYPDAPYNLAVAVAGPRASRNTALATLPPAVVLIAAGLIGGQAWPRNETTWTVSSSSSRNPTPDDIPLIISADGLLTVRGGSTSHAAVAINGIEDRKYSGVMSAAHLRVHANQHEAVILDRERGAASRIRKGDIVSIHGTTGEVHLGSRRRQLTEV